MGLIWAELSPKTTTKREKCGLVCDKPVPDLSLSFCPNFLPICWWHLVSSGEFSFQKFVTNQLMGTEFCLVAARNIYPCQVYEPVNFNKKSRFHIIRWSVQDGKSVNHSQIFSKWKFLTRIWQMIPFHQYLLPPATFWFYAQRNRKFRVCSKYYLWIWWLVEKQW